MEPPTFQNVDYRISTHEAVCAERYLRLTENLDKVAGRIGKLEGLVWVIAGTLICALAGTVFALMLRLPAFNH